MPQTETLLLILLGFSLAALIFLFAARLLWSAAIRIGARRMQRQVPSTVAGLQSERDRLRAEYAKISQKLSARLESLRMQMAEHMSEVTRNRNRIETLVQELNGRDEMLATRDNELEARDRKLGQAEQELKALRNEVHALNLELARKDRELAELTAGWEPARAEPAIALPAAGPALPFPSAGEPSSSDERLRQRIEKLTAMSQQMAETRTVEQLPAAAPLIADKFGEAARETEDLQKELARLDAAWNSVAEAPSPAPGNTQPAAEPPGAVANVVSLANRLRSLKNGFVK